jgi:hypothetical protein
MNGAAEDCLSLSSTNIPITLVFAAVMTIRSLSN